MNHSRREERVRALMDGPHPHVPPELAQLALARGQRVLRRRRTVRNVLRLLLVLALVVLALWALSAQPWDPQTTPVTPPGFGW